MGHKNLRKRSACDGFTLFETLIALAVASALIATLIPIARTTQTNIIKREREFVLLSMLMTRIQGGANINAAPILDPQSFKLSEKRSALPPFTYDKDQKQIWQPVLVRIEAADAAGQRQQVEIIRLERQSP